jgi:dTDP-4-amino-4,6-dideoxygalactose transaminase
VHDTVAYNYRLPNINAALGVAQMEYLDKLIENKIETAAQYREFFLNKEIKYFSMPVNSNSNYWLNTILLKDKNERDAFLEYTNSNGVMTRPAWKLINKLVMYKNCESNHLYNSNWFEERIVNIPSSYRGK